MLFLEKMQEISKTLEEKLSICQNPVMFASGKSKKLWVQAAKKESTTGVQNGKITLEEGKTLIENFTQGLTLSGFLKQLTTTGTLAVLINPLGNAIEQQSEDIVSWHTYAVIYKDGVLGVYDSSFVKGRKTFQSCRGVAFVKGFVKALKGKRKVTEIWFGGGGNKGTDCQEMTRMWIEREIVYQKGANLGNWCQRRGWVQVEF